MVYHKPRKSCLDCRRRHLKCSLPDGVGGSASCVWCQEHGLECVKDWESSDSNNLRSQAPKDGAIILNGSNSAFGGFQFSKASLLPNDGPSATRVLRLRQEVASQHKSSTSPWIGGDTDADQELRLDKPVIQYLKNLFFSNVHPYIPIIGISYFESIKPTQLLLSAMYGVAARLPGAIVSTRDFLHIKRVLEYQLKNYMSKYEPSIQTLQALTLIHLTLELQCEGLEGVETWPLRLAAAVRMAFELRLHRKETYAHEHPLMQEMKRRLFWAIFAKDRWTSTGKGYPLMIDMSDINVDFPSPHDIDNPTAPPHEYFVELIQQAITLGRIHPVCFRADRFAHVTPAQFRLVEQEVVHLELIPNASDMRVLLANDSVRALGYTSKELLLTGPSIWGIMFYAQVRCFLVALSIKHDPITDYDGELRSAAGNAVEKVGEIAKFMCEDKKWSFMILSGTLAIFTKRVAEDKDAVKKLSVGGEGKPGRKGSGGRKRRAVDTGDGGVIDGRKKRDMVIQTAGLGFVTGVRSVDSDSTVDFKGETPTPVQMAGNGDFGNWDLGNDYSEDIDWQEWDMMFSGIA
ncbi:uncharacterized protein LAJ45_04040 [Morchella importuna]|uniref:uncharacterized protein n=1 Tax=Morchella importuna TaxID=1174673 RepID=UPI001E8CDE10|nr:uncharacterized protein LAJ45_04040 [Morchella importuna]KAH8152046.1 hypothetical protein LAJ45_04040 [Morchella importuna]